MYTAMPALLLVQIHRLRSALKTCQFEWTERCKTKRYSININVVSFERTCKVDENDNGYLALALMSCYLCVHLLRLCFYMPRLNSIICYATNGNLLQSAIYYSSARIRNNFSNFMSDAFLIK